MNFENLVLDTCNYEFEYKMKRNKNKISYI